MAKPALKIRPDDRDLKIPGADIQGETTALYMYGDVETMRWPEWVKAFGHPALDGSWHTGVIYFTPSPAALERANEIIQAYDQLRNREVPRGYYRSQGRLERQHRLLAWLERKISKLHADSIHGVAAKWRCCQVWGSGLDEDLSTSTLVRSIVSDVARLDKRTKLGLPN